MIVVISSSDSGKPLIPMKDNECDMIGVEWAVNIVVAHYIAYIAHSKLRFDCIADRFSIREFVFSHLIIGYIESEYNK